MTSNEAFSPDDFPAAWCRMWNADPSLAHRLIGPNGRQWASRTAGLDPVVGPGPTEAFIAEYAVAVGNKFQPRVPVLGADLLGYSWEATKRDGSRLNGVDLNVLEDGKVVDNWTFATDAWDGQPDPTLEPAESAEQLLEAVRQDAVERGVQVHRNPVVDASRGTAIYLWQRRETEPGGIEALAMRTGHISWRWSLAATRPFRY